MQEIEVITHLLDDIDAEKSLRVAADGSHRLVLDESEVVLDLTDEHFEVLANFLDKYFAVGRKPDVKKTKGKTPRRTGLKSPEYYAGLQAYADEHGIKYRYGEAGNLTYSRQLHNKFQATPLGRELAN